jgi:CDP-diacylglycerol--serine O-phosphatidyltransferase
MRKIAVLPSLITLGNLICGFAAICVLARPDVRLPFVEDRVVAASWLIMMGMILDVLDGKLARMTRVTSDFGGQLDSLSDCLTFGVAPAVLVVVTSTLQAQLVWLLAGLYATCAALRLARFNVEHSAHTKKEDYFKGMPSPAAAGLIVSAIIFDRSVTQISSLKTQAGALRTDVILPFLALTAGLLMVSRVRYPHLLGWILKGKKRFADLVRIVFVCAFIAWRPQFAFIVLFSAYAVSGIVQTTRMVVAAKWRARKHPAADHLPGSGL